MATVWILSNQYIMLGGIDYPHFYWAVFSFPLIFFSRTRFVSFSWALIFFVTLLYWLPDQGWFANSNTRVASRIFLIYLTPLWLGLLYLASQYYQVHNSIQNTFQAALLLSFLACIFLVDFNIIFQNDLNLNQSIDISPGPYTAYLTAVAIAMILVICFLKEQTLKQKSLLSVAILGLLTALLTNTFHILDNRLLGIATILIVFVSLIFFYASKHSKFTVDALAIICSLHLSLSISVIYFSYIFLINPLLPAILFVGLLTLYFWQIRKKIL